MIYKLYTSNGDRLRLSASRVEQDGTGTKFYDDQNLVASFYCGELVRFFPDDAIEEAEVTPSYGT